MAIRVVSTIQKLDRVKERIKRWQAKLRRAENALKKLTKQEKYYEKRLSTWK